MKKNSGQSPHDEPMGIVIAMGGRAPTVPQVRAYLWYEWNPELTAEKKAASE